MSLRPLSLALFVLLVGLLATPLVAGTISVTWDPVNDPTLSHYRIYIGSAPGNYSQHVDVGLTTETTLSGLADCTEHFLAVKAVNEDEVESDFYSNEVSGWTRPVVSSVSPLAIESGASTQLTISGSNFQPGATVQFVNPGIQVDGVNVNGCGQMVANVTVDPGATVGSQDLNVVNPDQVFGPGLSLFAIQADDTAPAIAGLDAGTVGATSATINWTTNEPADSQVFYRPVGQSTYQVAPVETSMVQSHSVTVQGLSPEQAYQFYVSSTDDDGNASTTSASAFTTLASSFAYIRFEAESGLVASPFETIVAPVAFRGAWIELPDGASGGTTGNPSGTQDYGVFVPYDSTWHVWYRIYAASSGDSWAETVDGSGFDSLAATQSGEWEWVEGQSWVLTEGLHTVTVGGLATGARVDRVLVTDDAEFLPTEQPGDDVQPPPNVNAAGIVAGDGAVGLSWTNPTGADAETWVVRYRTDGQHPVSPADGLPLSDSPIVPAASDGTVHNDVTNGTTYSYSIFTVDEWGNASEPIELQATPVAPTPSVPTNLRRSDTLN